MKLSLVVLTPGPGQGSEISIHRKQFLIGRDPGCHLRPASAHVSNCHCAILQREDKVFIRDYGSTNGTFVNDRQIKASEIELHDGDRLRIGQLVFTIRLEPEVVTPLTQPLPQNVAMKNGRSSHHAIPRTEGPVYSAGRGERSATIVAIQERGVPAADQPSKAPDFSTVSDASFATLAEEEKPKQTVDDPSIATAVGISVKEGAGTAAQKLDEANQEATVQAPGLKIRKFLVGLLLGFGVTNLALSAWVVSLLTVVDWLRGDDRFISRLPSRPPLWLAVVLTFVVPLLALRAIAYVWKHRTR